nr:immunoglobulin light chain junction region [Macaca mulatta]MOW43508.1 immunoglobulin light chain junction region [Macaca mulatta]MOW51691.1 immunoglobulin light chain junction region [Macaca mulatta]MOW52632.1 immunoglobulin light chain junction region [Macaca mulatta]MOY00626.1 immunoglobulin light chain junction region [Macaca mulatta]
CMQALEFLWTF